MDSNKEKQCMEMRRKQSIARFCDLAIIYLQLMCVNVKFSYSQNSYYNFTRGQLNKQRKRGSDIVSIKNGSYSVILQELKCKPVS